MKTTFSILLSLILSSGAFAVDGSGLALLRAALDFRQLPNNFNVAFSYVSNAATKGAVLNSAKVELLFLNDRRLTIFERTSEKDVAWFDGEYGWAWSLGVNADLVRHDQKYLQDKGLFYFDPANFGVLFVNSASRSHENLLQAETFVLKEAEVVNGVRCEVVAATGGPYLWEGTSVSYFIEEPKLRIHKVIATGKSRKNNKLLHEVVSSTFSDQSSFPTWLPSQVSVNSPEYGNWTIADIRISNQQLTTEDFTIKSANIPLGTAVVDYNLGRRLGYWTGEEISEDGVVYSEPSRWNFWNASIFALGVFSLGYLAFIWHKRRQ